MLKTLNRIWKNAPYNKLKLEHRIKTVAEKWLVYSGIQSSIGYREPDFPKRYISKVADNKVLKPSENIAKKYREMEANLKWRNDPVITTLDTPQFKLILRKNILDLVALFQKYGYEIRIAGGAVRLGFHVHLHWSFGHCLHFIFKQFLFCFFFFSFFLLLLFFLFWFQQRFAYEHITA